MTYTRKKITVVGAGNVGAMVAHWIAAKELGDVFIIDVIDGLPQGKALDLFQASPVRGFHSNVIGTNDYKDTSDSDIVILAAGLPRKPGMNRDDLLVKNTAIVKSVTERIVEYSPNAFLIVVTNPLDAMVYVAHKVSKFPKNRVVGMAGVLDTARFRTFIALELDVSVEDISALVLGGHGDSMVPLPRYTTVSGIPLAELLPPEKIEALVNRTRNAGDEILNMLKTQSAFLAPSAATFQMAEAILKDKKRILPCAAYCDQEYGIGGYFVGVPVKLGKDGVEKVIEVKLLPDEKAAFDKSAEAVRRLVNKIQI
ncbi:MAG: malate dehydrogenase [Syntrophobacteraceae bacterium]